MEIGLIEIGLKQLLARKSCNYVDQIDKIVTCSIVNMEHKSSTTKTTQKRMKTWYKFKLETWNMKVGNNTYNSMKVVPKKRNTIDQHKNNTVTIFFLPLIL